VAEPLSKVQAYFTLISSAKKKEILFLQGFLSHFLKIEKFFLILMSLRKIKKISKFGVLFRKKLFFNFQIDKSVNPDPNFSVCFFTLLESFDLGEEREKGEELKKFSKKFLRFF